MVSWRHPDSIKIIFLQWTLLLRYQFVLRHFFIIYLFKNCFIDCKKNSSQNIFFWGWPKVETIGRLTKTEYVLFVFSFLFISHAFSLSFSLPSLILSLSLYIYIYIYIYGEVANVQDCIIVIRESTTSCPIVFTFWLIPFWKGWTPKSPKKWVKRLSSVLLREWVNIDHRQIFICN